MPDDNSLAAIEKHLAVIDTKLDYVRSDIDILRDKLSGEFVTHVEFKTRIAPLEKLHDEFVTKSEFNTRVPLLEKVIFGVISLIGAGVVGAFLKLVILR